MVYSWWSTAAQARARAGVGEIPRGLQLVAHCLQWVVYSWLRPVYSRRALSAAGARESTAGGFLQLGARAVYTATTVYSWRPYSWVCALSTAGRSPPQCPLQLGARTVYS